jgi:hypothetical protein
VLVPEGYYCVCAELCFGGASRKINRSPSLDSRQLFAVLPASGVPEDQQYCTFLETIIFYFQFI